MVMFWRNAILVLSQAARSLLFGIEPQDPLTLGVGFGVFGAVGGPGQTPDALNEGEQRTPAAYRTLARGGNYVVARRIERLIEHLVSQDTVDREKRTSAMTEEEKDKAKAAAVASVGAGVGSAGGATVGVLELAARGAATGLSAGLVIGLGAAAGAGIAYGIYRIFKKRKS